jgi:hypothetical protein
MLLEGSSFDPLADENLGAMVIGLAISLVLCGVVINQGYSYYQTFGDDKAYLKALVSCELVMNQRGLLYSIGIWGAHQLKTAVILCVDFLDHLKNTFGTDAVREESSK